MPAPQIKHLLNRDWSNVLEICQALSPEWRKVSKSDLEITEISGGLTNCIKRLRTKSAKTLDPVVVRLFGENTEILIDRPHEAMVSPQIEKEGFGAKVIGHFGNGRIEEFLDCKTLDSTDAALPVLAKRIAKKLNEFHNITVPEEKRPMLFHTLRSMLATARSITFADTLKQKTLDGINLDSLENDITEMENICKAMGSPTVYSHNDLLPGNIVLLRDKETGEACLENSTMNFIDFEYSSYSYRGFDIGNHFNEYAGFDCDWSLYPAEDQQRLFIAAYLDIEPSAEQESLERLVVEANFFSLLSNMLWGCWSIVQAKYSPIDFDYLAYCINRLDEYYRQKPKRVEAVKSLLLTNGHV